MIEHYISNIQLLFPLTILTTYAILSETEDDSWGVSSANEYHFTTVLLELVIVLYYWNRTMYKSVDAIRYLNPSWYKVHPGNRLWPSLFYLFGLRKRDSYPGTESGDSKQEQTEAPVDNVKDSIITLMTDF